MIHGPRLRAAAGEPVTTVSDEEAERRRAYFSERLQQQIESAS